MQKILAFFLLSGLLLNLAVVDQSFALSGTIRSMPDPTWSSFWSKLLQASSWTLSCLSGTILRNVTSTLVITTSQVSNIKRKTTVSFKTLYGGDYNLTFEIKQPILNYVNNSLRNNITLTYRFLGCSIVFDWNDVAKISIVKWTMQIVNDRFRFVIYKKSVSRGVTLNIDPITIGTTTTGEATYQSPQRKLIHCNATELVYYSNGTDMVYSTSGDGGSSWSSPIKAVAGITSGYFFSVRQYNISGVCYLYLVYMLSTSGANNQIRFKRGIMYSPTRIFHAIEYYAVGASLLESRGLPEIEMDTNGALYISYSRLWGSNLYMRIVRNTNNDGNPSPNTYWYGGSAPYWTWAITTGNGTLTVLNSGFARLLSGKVYAAYTSNAVTWTAGTLWSGTGWTNETINTIVPCRTFSLAGVNDTVLFSYNNFTASAWWVPWFRFRNETDSTWSSPQKVSNYVSFGEPISLTVNATNNGDCWMFWKVGNVSQQIYYSKRTWASKTFSIATNCTPTEDEILLSTAISSWVQTANGKIGLVWIRYLNSINYLRFTMVNVAAAAPTVTTFRISTINVTYTSLKFLKILLSKPSQASASMVAVTVRKEIIFRLAVVDTCFIGETVRKTIISTLSEVSVVIVQTAFRKELIIQESVSSVVFEQIGFRKDMIFQQSVISETVKSSQFYFIGFFQVFAESTVSETFSSLTFYKILLLQQQQGSLTVVSPYMISTIQPISSFGVMFVFIVISSILGLSFIRLCGKRKRKREERLECFPKLL